MSHIVLRAKLPSAAAEAVADNSRCYTVDSFSQIRAFEHDDGDVVLVKQGQDAHKFMIQPHIARNVSMGYSGTVMRCIPCITLSVRVFVSTN